MKIKLSVVSALAVLAAPSAPLHAQSAKAFRPSSVWAADYGDGYCRLMRDFSDGTSTVGLFIEQTGPWPQSMRLALVGDSIRLFRGADEIGYRFAPSGAPRTTPRVVSATAEGDQYINLGAASFSDAAASAGPGAAPGPRLAPKRDEEVAAAAKITSIALEKGLTSPVVIETGEMGSVAAALQTCTDDLVESWGLDSDKHKTLKSPALPSGPAAGWIPADTISFQDFPKLSGGNNEIRVMVNAAGKPTSCHVQWMTLDEATNKKICDGVMANGTFTPAADQSGQAIDSVWITSAGAFMSMPRRR